MRHLWTVVHRCHSISMWQALVANIDVAPTQPRPCCSYSTSPTSEWGCIQSEGVCMDEQDTFSRELNFVQKTKPKRKSLNFDFTFDMQTETTRKNIKNEQKFGHNTFFRKVFSSSWTIHSRRWCTPGQRQGRWGRWWSRRRCTTGPWRRTCTGPKLRPPVPRPYPRTRCGSPRRTARRTEPWPEHENKEKRKETFKSFGSLLRHLRFWDWIVDFKTFG